MDAKFLRKRLGFVVLTAMAILVQNQALAGEMILRVLTYNVWGLPLPFMDSSRFTDIGKALKKRRDLGTAPHVVSIQEAFHSKTKHIHRIAKYPYVAKGPGRGIFRVRSGIQIFSEFPILEVKKRKLTSCAGPDCLARKSLLIAKIEIPEVPESLWFLNTHLDAGRKVWEMTGNDTSIQTIGVRKKQMRQLIHFLAENDLFQRFFMMAGDFNFNPGYEDYDMVRLIPGVVNATEQCSQLKTCEQSDGDDAYHDFLHSVDHQFYTANPKIQIRPIYFEKVLKESVNGRRLSDHDGLEIHYQLSW